jgi:hypothetical protein
VFESVAAEIIGTMILAATLANEIKLAKPAGFMMCAADPAKRAARDSAVACCMLHVACFVLVTATARWLALRARLSGWARTLRIKVLVRGRVG